MATKDPRQQAVDPAEAEADIPPSPPLAGLERRAPHARDTMVEMETEVPGMVPVVVEEAEV